MKIKKGDTVEVITGNDRGKRGEVVDVFPNKNKLTVRGMNVSKKHAKANRGARRVTQAGLLDVEMPIDASNVKLVTPSGKASRVNYLIENGTKKRYSNKFDEVLN